MKNFFKYLLMFLLIGIMALILAKEIIMKEEVIKTDDFTLVVKQNEKGWFYELYEGNALVIKQETIPALPGNHHFAKKADAVYIGTIVLNKLQAGVFPPTITIKEIEMNTIYKKPS